MVVPRLLTQVFLREGVDVSVGALALTCLAGSATERGAEEYLLDEIATSCTPATPVG